MIAEGTTFAAEKIVQTGPQSYFVQHGTDKNLFVEFYVDAEYQEFESLKEGRPIYKDVEMIRIRTPGINGNTIERKVKLKGDPQMPADPDRFPNQWRAFKAQQEQRPDGFPIEQAAFLTKAQIMSFKGQGILVLEQIATMPDTNIHILGMGGPRLRDMAKSFLERDKAQEMLASATAERDSLRNDLEAMHAAIETLKGGDTAKLAEEMAAMRQQFTALKSENEALKAAAASQPVKKKRGRPSNKDKENTNGH